MATKFGMQLQNGETLVPLAERIPEFAKTHDEVEDSIRTSRRGQMQEMVTDMILDPDRFIPALYGHHTKVKRQHAKERDGSKVVNASVMKGVDPALCAAWVVNNSDYEADDLALIRQADGDGPFLLMQHGTQLSANLKLDCLGVIMTEELLFGIWDRCHNENGQRLINHKRDSGWTGANPRPNFLRAGSYAMNFDANGKMDTCTHRQSAVVIGTQANPLPDYVHITNQFSVKNPHLDAECVAFAAGAPPYKLHTLFKAAWGSEWPNGTDRYTGKCKIFKDLVAAVEDSQAQRRNLLAGGQVGAQVAQSFGAQDTAKKRQQMNNARQQAQNALAAKRQRAIGTAANMQT